MQQPAAVGTPDRDAAVPAGVAPERDEDDVVAERRDRLQPEPLVPGHGVPLPPGAVRPLGSDVPRALAQPRVGRSLQLVAEHVDPGPREVAEAAGVVEVEVGECDVGDVGGRDAERGELGDDPVAGGQDQDVADELGAAPQAGFAVEQAAAARAAGGGVEMTDLHGCGSTVRSGRTTPSVRVRGGCAGRVRPDCDAAQPF